MKEKATISVTEVSVLEMEEKPGLQRSRSKWSRQQIPTLSDLKARREGKARAAAVKPEIDIVLPPLSPIVDDEFWRTGRYPTSPLGLGMVHVAF